MARLFTGDYSTGDFRQWTSLANAAVGANSTIGSGVFYPRRGLYPAQVVTESADCGYVGRFELRSGDVPHFGGDERSEVFGLDATLATPGQTRWYAMSIKFDPTFPTNHRVLGSGTLIQWHDKGTAGNPGVSLASPLLALGWAWPGFSGFADDKWSLRFSTVNESYVVTSAIPLAEFPYDLGQWHDLKFQIRWAYDETGFVRCWRNGVRQTLSGGVDTFYGANVPSPAVGVVVQQGYYRTAMAPTGIVYHAGFRMADSEASL